MKEIKKLEMKYWYEIEGKKEERGSKRQKKKSLMVVKPATPFSRCTATEYISEDVVGQVYM